MKDKLRKKLAQRTSNAGNNTGTLTHELLADILKFIAAADAICLPSNASTSDTNLFFNILSKIHSAMGNDCATQIGKIIALNADLNPDSKYFRRLQIHKLREQSLLPEALINEIERYKKTKQASFTLRAGLFMFAADYRPGDDVHRISGIGINRTLPQALLELGSTSLLHRFIDLGYQDWANKSKSSLLYNSICCGLSTIVEVLLKNNRIMNYLNVTLHHALLAACIARQVNTVELLLQSRIDYTQLEHTESLVEGSWSNNPICMLLLMYDAVDADANHQRTVFSAHQRQQQVEIIRLLCAYRNAKGQGFLLAIPRIQNSVIIAAVRSREPKMLAAVLRFADKKLIADSIDIANTENITALGYAARFGIVSMVSQLLNAGANPNLPADAALHRPISMCKRTDIRVMLLTSNAEPIQSSHHSKIRFPSGEIMPTHSLLREALVGSSESLAVVIQKQSGDDAERKQLLSESLLLACRFVLGMENGFERQNTLFTTKDPLNETCKKVRLLIEAGADCGAPLITDPEINLFEMAILFNAPEIIRVCLPHNPKLSNGVITKISRNAAKSSSQFHKTLELLYTNGYLQNEVQTIILRDAIGENNTSLRQWCYQKDFNTRILNQRLYEPMYMLAHLFITDLSRGKKQFVAMMKELLWVLEINPQSVDEDTESMVAEIFEKHFTRMNMPIDTSFRDKYTMIFKLTLQQIYDSKQSILATLQKLSDKLKLSTKWQGYGQFFFLGLRANDFKRLAFYLPGLTYDEHNHRAVIRIIDEKFEPRDISTESYEYESNKKGLSSRAFLMREHGMTAVEVAALQAENAQITEENDVIAFVPEVVVTPTWLGGRISADHNSITELEGEGLRQFLYIDMRFMLTQGCPATALADLRSVRKFGSGDKKCLKPIEGKLKRAPCRYRLFDQVHEMTVTHEIRAAKIEWRLLCGPALRSDQQGLILYLAVLAIESMHTTGNINAATQKLKNTLDGDREVFELSYATPKDK